MILKHVKSSYQEMRYFTKLSFLIIKVKMKLVKDMIVKIFLILSLKHQEEIIIKSIMKPIKIMSQFLSQFLKAPTIHHFKASQTIIRYIKKAPAQGLYFPSNSEIQLKGFADSDWASCKHTRRSTTGLYVFLGSSLISWKSKKQTMTSRSSTCEIQWLSYILNDLNINDTKW